MNMVHVTLPHGNKEGFAWQRNFANRVVKILVWCEAKVAGTEGCFSWTLDELTAMRSGI